jgi:uncharacterized protein YlxW (UPF0749 family)
MPDQVPDQMPDQMPSQTPEPAQQELHEDHRAHARRRILTGLRSTSRRQLIVGLLVGLLGFAAVTQVRATDTDDTYAGQRQQDLIDILDALAGTRQRADAEINRLEKVRDSLRDDTTRRQAALDQANGEVSNLQILAGLVPVTGPGIRITITEHTGQVRLSSMLDTIEELRTVGAEAIQVNGKVRVVAQTSFQPVTGGFRIDDQLVQAPYVIDVIGDPGVLSGAMSFALGPKQQLDDDGADVQVDQLSSLDIQAVAAKDHTRYAAPLG